MLKEVEKVVISTIYEGFAIKHIIPKLSPDKLILLIDEPKIIEKKEKMYKVLKTLKEFFKDSIIIETEKISSYNIPKIMSEVIEIIDKESKKNNEVIVHVTEGRKTTSFAVLFASYMRRDKVNGAYYITEEGHELINLPLINLKLGESKKRLLKEIAKGNGIVQNLEKKIEIKQSAIYQHIQELKEEGYLKDSKELNLTDLGRIMIL